MKTTTIENLKMIGFFSVTENDRNCFFSNEERVYTYEDKLKYSFTYDESKKSLYVSGGKFGKKKWFEVLNTLEVLFLVAKGSPKITVELKESKFDISNIKFRGRSTVEELKRKKNFVLRDRSIQVNKNVEPARLVSTKRVTTYTFLYDKFSDCLYVIGGYFGNEKYLVTNKDEIFDEVSKGYVCIVVNVDDFSFNIISCSYDY